MLLWGQKRPQDLLLRLREQRWFITKGRNTPLRPMVVPLSITFYIIFYYY